MAGSANISSWAAAGHSASSHMCAAQSMYTQPVDAHWAASSTETSISVSAPSSEPPKRRGCMTPHRPLSSRSATVSSGRRRSRSASGIRARRRGPSERAASIASSWLASTGGGDVTVLTDW